ncbi:CST complex subunit STN1 isoform X2 [Nematostella vectensis]|uniref:CST complex subunit STN1 isoform X2 n=1 Tax=Nematostella vectensis TaxID=45351 RepID=UPI0020774D8C|nr:CST complex subunit STN1 isoform X2 [Nematostella vectensis]
MAEADSLPPVRYWGLDPLFWIHRKMFIVEILKLTEISEYKGFYAINRHPFSRVEIVGYVISLHERERLITYGVDDGSGSIDCCQWQKDDPDEDRITLELGELICVQGKITAFREKRQITVDFIYPLEDKNSEVLFWLDVLHLRKTVYSKPFNPSGELNSSEGSLPTLKDLAQHIRGLLKDGNIGFRSICSQKKVQELAELVQVTGDGTKVDSNSTATTIRKALRLLEKDGAIYHRDASDNYEVITHSKHLAPAILNIVQHCTKDSPVEGVHFTRIQDGVRSSHKFRHVTRDQIMHSLHLLVCDSELFQPQDRFYCLLT